MALVLERPRIVARCKGDGAAIVSAVVVKKRLRAWAGDEAGLT